MLAPVSSLRHPDATARSASTDWAVLPGRMELPLLLRREDRLHAGRRGDHETLHLGKQSSDPIPHVRVGQLPAARDDLCYEGFEYQVRASADLDSDRLQVRDLRAREPEGVAPLQHRCDGAAGEAPELLPHLVGGELASP